MTAEMLCSSFWGFASLALSALAFLMPACYFISFSELRVLSGERTVQSYKLRRSLTFHLLKNMLRKRHSVVLSKDELPEAIRSDKVVQETLLEVLKVTVLGSASLSIMGTMMIAIMANEAGCW